MLANGIKLGYSTSKNGSYTDLEGLKEVPEMGIEPEKVENTCLSDTVKQYEFGIGDAGDLTYKFKYDNSKSTSPYRVMRAYQASKTVLYFRETLPDGTLYDYAAQVSVKRSGGAVNGVLEFDLNMALQSEIEVTDPSTSA